MSAECPAWNVRLHETLVSMGFPVGQMSDECQEGCFLASRGQQGRNRREGNYDVKVHVAQEGGVYSIGQY